MAIVTIACRDKLAYDLELQDFSIGLSQFPGAKFTSGKATPHASKDGAATLIEDPIVEVDNTQSDPDEVREFIDRSNVFRLRR